jgi:hypothetical protein
MVSVHVERLDHLGLIACMIKDFGLIRMIDARLIPDEQEEITPGEVKRTPSSRQKRAIIKIDCYTDELK